MDQVIIRDLLARGVIGISDRERDRPQDILINLVFFTDISQAGISDDIQYCINYAEMSRKVITLAESAKRYTVETLATDIANLCLQESKAQAVRVRVEKPGAVRFAKSVGVEIERTRTT